jgi:predicted lactoylglutathione lyase
MNKQIFINLPVVNIEKSFALYTAIGFAVNEQFSDASAKCMVWSESIFVMLMSHEKMNGFTSKPIANTTNNIAALYAITMNNVEALHITAEAAIKLGAIEPVPFKDHGFMQVRTIEDYDGHTWELFCMDTSNMAV